MVFGHDVPLQAEEHEEGTVENLSLKVVGHGWSGWRTDQSREGLADAIARDGWEEWMCKFSSETNVWTRWRCRRCYSNVPAGLQGKHKQALFAKNKEWSSGSSSSSGGDERKHSDEEEELKKLRSQVELLIKQQEMERLRKKLTVM